jgi:hypothetical protein
MVCVHATGDFLFWEGRCVVIDVSSLTVLQGLIVTLIERRGNAGRRVCELYEEVPTTRRAVENNLKILIENGFITKVNGDVPKYYAPNVGTSHTPESSPKPAKVEQPQKPGEYRTFMGTGVYNFSG